MKNSYLKFILIFFTLHAATTLYAQKPDIYFDHFDVKKGLPEGQARVILEDNLGYIWIGTQNGLVRYDGYRSKIYYLGSAKLNKDPVTNIESMVIDKNNTIWATAINNGLFRYNRYSDTFEQFVLPPDKSIFNLVIAVADDHDNIWGRAFTYDGRSMVVKYAVKENKFEFFGDKEKGIHYLNAYYSSQILKTASGDVWFATTNGFYRYNGPNKPLKGFMTQTDTAKQRGANPIYEAPSQPGILWMNTFHGHNIDLRLSRFDMRNNSLKEYVPSKLPDSLPNAYINAIKEDKQQQLWIATEQGLIKLDRKTGKFSSYVPGDDTKTQSANNLVSFYETRNGNFWISSQVGMLYFDTNTKQFKRYAASSTNPGALASNYSVSALVDHTGVLWVGFRSAGADRLNYARSAFKVYKYDPARPNQYPENLSVSPGTNEFSWATGEHGIYKWDHKKDEFIKLYSPDAGGSFNHMAKAGKDGLLYAGSTNGLTIIDTKTGKHETYGHNPADTNSLADNQITATYQDHTGLIWIGNSYNGGISSFDPKTKKFKHYPHRKSQSYAMGNNDGKLDDDHVLSIFEDSKGVLWVGTNNGGLNRFDRKTQKFTSYFNAGNRKIYCVDDIFEDKAGRLWVATYLTGLFVFDRDKGTWTKHFDESSGLLFNSEVGINEDDKGRIWMLSERGLSRIDPKNWSIRNFDISNVLANNDASRGLSILTRLPGGRFGFMLRNGYAVFNPNDLDDSPYPPMVHLESITYNDPLADEKMATQVVCYGRKTIKLAYNENRVQFNYVALQYDDPTKNTYAYKLDGYDKQWIYAGTQRSVTYTNLPAGSYTFHVKAANSDGVWNNTGDSIGIVISPPWWSTWWAWGLYSVVLVLAGYSYINYRQKHLKEENRLLEEKINERTHELSQANKALGEQSEEIIAQRDQLADTVTELKTTQQQLIQSEKLASLGELTAGIAHEIQNPLNFVNNFSEVSIELSAEMREELAAGNTDDAAELASDIEQNLQKILHHGKRADAIVKNMLQHSRNNSGDKQLTDINALADEYLRLAYHGLRAKDKSFNATLVTDFDKNLPKITIIPQDIGRVLLNIINNAFYALQQKQKKADANYKPTLELITMKKNGAVVIIVKDNGIGIPEQVKGKIMQPFFTTKPTGEGTGLGLSLSYDIVVKGHGGKIDIQTQEGEFTEFIIALPATNL
ncbi:sensor histidine kinase [Mucilaginibacter ginsenosidivorax]|uniref:histidine kinase n=1 Tax=Mucilaginibacter ginsenosidivorax TaxID=862126 RepID=A0A5B8VUW8_9SPHI|nr:two-component regulator propeller domain-containing protein [Mucilaginibacter ginsenosidivorax]QEC75053.1 GHKL domain-containing protein [Mucilaginibacter ginsenosidivorax]